MILNKPDKKQPCFGGKDEKIMILMMILRKGIKYTLHILFFTNI